MKKTLDINSLPERQKTATPVKIIPKLNQD